MKVQISIAEPSAVGVPIIDPLGEAVILNADHGVVFVDVPEGFQISISEIEPVSP